MTTMSALEAEPTAQVKRLMHGRDAVEVSGWAHKVNKKFPWTVDLHFQRQKDAGTCGKVDLSECPGNKCLVKALKHFYGRLVNKPTVDIDWGAGIKLTDADCVKYLINLIGDLHQPMHFSPVLSAEHANITVVYRGKEMSMFDMWDREITQTTIKDNPGFWWGGWTHVQRTRVEYETDGHKWQKDGPLEFDRWAEETHTYLCDKIYKNPITGKQIFTELSNGKYHVHEELFQLWKRELLSKMLVAGARTAIVLNSVLHHREGAPGLHGGTAVSGVDEGDEEAPSAQAMTGRHGDPHHATHGTKAIHGLQATGYNICIFLAVGVVFVQVMRSIRGTDSLNQADRAKQQSGGKKI